MKFTLLPLLLVVSSIGSVFGFGGAPGGPFSNGQYFPNDGTFTAVVRGLNLVGTVTFSTTTTGGNGSSGISTIYYNGATFTGNTQGSYNPQASSMVVNFQADSEGQGQQTYSASTQTPAGTTISTETVTYFDAQSLDGVAQCKMSNAFPNQIFKGTGEANFRQLVFPASGAAPELNVVQISPISVSGVRLSNTATNFTSSDVRPPSVNEYSTLTTP